MIETNPVWIKFYQDKLVSNQKKIERLDRDKSNYWPKFTKLTKEIAVIKTKLGIKP